MVRLSGIQKKLGVVVLTVLVGGASAYSVQSFPTASNQGYIPEQPIPYSHKLHAGTLKIPCLYCHYSAEKSKHAGVPPLEVCMNCHRIVKTDSPYIQKLTAAYNAGQPIEWIRVHELPDYVYFPHKRHVAKGIACQVCHGNIQEMERVQQHSALTMGWCMECHRGHTAPKSLLSTVYPNVQHPEGPVAPIQCSTCHH